MKSAAWRQESGAKGGEWVDSSTKTKENEGRAFLLSTFRLHRLRQLSMQTDSFLPSSSPPRLARRSRQDAARPDMGFSDVLFRLSDGERALWLKASDAAMAKIARAGQPLATPREEISSFDRSWNLPALFKQVNDGSAASQTTRGALRWAARVGNKAWTRAPKKKFESTVATHRRWQVEGEGKAVWAQERSGSLLINIDLPRCLEVDEAARWGLAKWEIDLFAQAPSTGWERHATADADGVFAWAQKAFAQLGPVVALDCIECSTTLSSLESMIQELPRVWARHERDVLAVASAAPEAQAASESQARSVAKKRNAARI